MSDRSRYYYLKDHLGSIRAVVNESNSIISAQDYDAWGYLYSERQYQASNRYKVTEKERDNETNGYDYFGARYYDSRLGRWLEIDPLFEKHIGWSPYNYVLNNTLELIDPDGQQMDAFHYYFGQVFSNTKPDQKAIKDIQNMSFEQQAEYYGLSVEEFRSGKLEPTYDEFLFLPAFNFEKTTISISKEATSISLSETFTISEKVAQKITSRGITESMVKKTIEKGEIFWDPKNLGFDYILKNKLLSGKSLVVGKTLQGAIKTAYPTSRISKRLIKLSEDASKIIRGF